MKRKSLLSLFILVFFLIIVVYGYRHYSLLKQGESASLPVKQHDLNVSINQEKTTGLTTEDVKEIVKKYIKENPGEIIKSVEELQLRKVKEDMDLASSLIKTKIKELEEDMDDPRAGSNTPKVKIVEYFDYNCGYCKRMLDTKKRILQENKDVQIVFKELPILGENSIAMSKAALAVNLVDKSKYFDFHAELLTQVGQKDQAAIEEIVKRLGIDLNKFKAALNDAKINSIISKNMKLAQEIRVQGSPAYIINGRFIPGAFNYEEFKMFLKDDKEGQQSKK